MPEKPYTDEDLRAEAASCLQALSCPPTPDDIRRSLPETYIDSNRTESSGREATWGGVLADEGLGVAVGKIHSLIEGAADVSEWAVNLGADGLEPDSRALDAGERRVRVHLAFAPDISDDDRADLIGQFAAFMTHGLT
ncbi:MULTISPECIES: hypothetical protein [unclassified Streptomyces]|uniref:hypothetical protein n=1 Tax=unclassified Streptomyces TaxID=2593676 RepID=UPI000BF175D1|nr:MULTISPECIES: hypothetical protein [unclassified Streptomyces]